MAISQKDIKLLWSRAAGRCSICRTELFHDKNSTSETLLIGEQAHIIAEESNGPRGTSPLSLEERNSYHNLILLCPNHHSEIDKNTEDYPPEKVYVIKSRHEIWVQQTLSKETNLNRSDLITIDDLLEFQERIRPIIFWLHRFVPPDKAKEYFQAMQSFWTTSNIATDHIPRKLRACLDRLLRPLVTEDYIFHEGRHYAESKIYAATGGILDYFHSRGARFIDVDREDTVEFILLTLNSHCEITQKTVQDLTDTEINILKYVRHIVQYYERHLTSKSTVEIPESLTDQFLAIIAPFLVDRLGVMLPDKEDDRALDRIQRFSEKREGELY